MRGWGRKSRTSFSVQRVRVWYQEVVRVPRVIATGSRVRGRGGRSGSSGTELCSGIGVNRVGDDSVSRELLEEYELIPSYELDLGCALRLLQ